MNFTRYANITSEQRTGIVEKFRELNKVYPTDQAIACTADDFWGLSNKQWSGKLGADVFAATLAVLVMEKEVRLVA